MQVSKHVVTWTRFGRFRTRLEAPTCISYRKYHGFLKVALFSRGSLESGLGGPLGLLLDPSGDPLGSVFGPLWLFQVALEPPRAAQSVILGLCKGPKTPLRRPKVIS